MRVSAKGQVTVPKELRDKIGIGEGSEVEFGLDGDVITLRRASPGSGRGLSRGQRLVKAIEGTATANRNLSTDEIMRLLRGDD
ncbi:MAG: AbrB/MazE/SpoVT family DNA-binding domain-containing protein [Rhizobiales bacterium]|nr:AbrB/MazE/SpoVT family DNA-binding domain-containing protein [Hyphomicrobiales bacterium]